MELLLFRHLLINFLLLSYSAIVPILLQIVALAYTLVLRIYLYQDEVSVAQQMIYFLSRTIFLVCGSLAIHFAISWIGFKYIAVEVQRESNE